MRVVRVRDPSTVLEGYYRLEGVFFCGGKVLYRFCIIFRPALNFNNFLSFGSTDFDKFGNIEHIR